MQRAGFALQTVTVEGLTWEVPDHYQRQAISVQGHRAFTERYDQDASRWELRVQAAWAILEAGLAALSRPLNEPEKKAVG